jgi:hypothetical protein
MDVVGAQQPSPPEREGKADKMVARPPRRTCCAVTPRIAHLILDRVADRLRLGSSGARLITVARLGVVKFVVQQRE